MKAPPLPRLEVPAPPSRELPPLQPPRRAKRNDEQAKRPAAKKSRRTERDDEEEEASPQVMGMTRRESMILIIGLVSVVGLAVLGLLIWLVLKLVS